MLIDELHGYYLLTTANCPTCSKVKELLNNLEDKPVIYEIDANSMMDIAKALNVIGTPCLLKMEYGQEVARLYGAPSVMRITKFFQGE